MARHALVPAPTNVGERIVRTIAQVGIPAFVALVWVLPDVIAVLDEDLGEHLPPAFRVWMVGLAATITAIAGVLVKVMALPRVNDWLSRWTRLGTVPPAAAREIHSDS